MQPTPPLPQPLARFLLPLGLAVFIAYLIVIASFYADGRAAAARGERPMLTDFTSLYAAALLVRQQPAADLYRPGEMFRASLLGAQAAYDGNLSENQARAIGMHPWMYPPSFILVAAPLAILPYLPALLFWLTATGLLYLSAMRRILQGPEFWLIALGAPPVFYNMIYGQSGFLVAGLIGLGLCLLRERPVLAGICIGLASVKPHFGVLIPFALICGMHWKAFWSATATVIASILLSVLILGLDPWYGFIGTLFANLRGFEAGIYKWWIMPSVMGALHQAGLDLAWAARGQMLATAAMLATVAWVWWRSPQREEMPELQSAVLCTATLLAVPMVYLYDQVLLVPAIALLWQDMRQRGYRVWEPLLMAAACLGLLAAIELGRLGPVYGALTTFTLLGLALRRMIVRPNPA